MLHNDFGIGIEGQLLTKTNKMEDKKNKVGFTRTIPMKFWKKRYYAYEDDECWESVYPKALLAD